MALSFAIAIVCIYTLALLFIFIYSLTQASLILRYFKNKNSFVLLKKDNNYQPFITIQLPIYNELYVVERLIDSVCLINYPIDKLEIQLLDDSTDETSNIIKSKVEEWALKGINIKHIQRNNREGYKAGALKNGLALAKGEYIAIFDSDFIIQPNFLNETLPYFIDNKVGMVQTKWGHLNKDFSLLTKLQAFGLDAHFTIEQVGRNYQGGFINFNGTAGIWRKSCIIDAGNWQCDTLTEDLDLSYRAQLKNWNFIYLENIESPAELPPVMSALKNQQYRWTKGGVETAIKHITHVIKSKKTISVKWHGMMHLLNSSVFLCAFLCAVLSVPLLYIKKQYPIFNDLFLIGTVFLINFLILIILYYVSLLYSSKNKLSAFVKLVTLFPMFLSVSMGLSLHNSIAVIEGLLGKKTSFVRTPKFNLIKNSNVIGFNKYVRSNLTMVNYLELIMVAYFVFGIYKGVSFHDYGFIILHAMLSIGFLIVFGFSFRQSIKS